MRRALVAVSVVLLLAVALAGGGWLAWRRVDVPGSLAAARAVVVPHGTLAQVADALAARHVVRRAIELRVAAFVTRGAGALHAGEFEFPARASLRVVLGILRTAKPLQHKLTIPDGLTAAQVAQLFERGHALAGDPVVPPEGGVLPETYLYDRGTTRAVLAGRTEAAMQKALDAAWAARSPGLALKSPAEALILASIVERESAKPEERPRIAAVFLNRLRLGMKLQSDPTVVYAVTGGLGTLDRPLSRADLAIESPYNTYWAAGLPPAPISMPSVAAIRAVTQPLQTDELYFVADGTGGHAFARTEEEHRQNVARWRHLERERAVPPSRPEQPAP